jgi:hypothetical protein
MRTKAGVLHNRAQGRKQLKIPAQIAFGAEKYEPTEKQKRWAESDGFLDLDSVIFCILVF